MAPHANADVQVTGTSDTTSMVIPDPVLTKNLTHAVFTIDDVLPHRQQSAPMPAGVASFGSAEMFKSRNCLKKPKAKDFSHRISQESASRQPSSLKNAMKYFRKDMISLCGGLPSSEYFPFESVSAHIPRPPQFSEQETAESGIEVTSRKHDIRDGTSLFDLSVCMNYGQSMGPPQLIRFFTEHTEIVHSPKYSDWEVVITAGNTSALEICLRVFCTRGDFVLTEEYSFSSAVETMTPQGLTPIGVAMDDYGMRADALEDILTNWDESVRGGPKPVVIYFVPTGQNPSGATQTLERRKEIYAVAEKHDLILFEDEPYYFLQMEPFTPGKTHEIKVPFTPSTPADFLSALVPSYLSLDISGRVVRMDSTSKILAPGCRIGWVTAPHQIAERIVRHQEVSFQNASGFATAIIYKLLEETWGHKGFLEWLMFLRAEYTRRRDVLLNACEDYLSPKVARWKAPTAGMFHWIEVDASLHPDVSSGKINTADVEEKLFLAAVDANVLVAKGSWFLAEKDNKVLVGPGRVSGPLEGLQKKDIETSVYFRMNFASASEEQMTDAVERFGKAIGKEFQLTVRDD